MTIVCRPSPFGELLSLRQALDLFEDSAVRPFGSAPSGIDGIGLSTVSFSRAVAESGQKAR